MCKGVCEQISEGAFHGSKFNFIKFDLREEFEDITKIILNYDSVYKPKIKIEYAEECDLPYIKITSRSRKKRKLDPTILYHGDVLLYDKERLLWQAHKESDFLDHFRIIK